MVTRIRLTMCTEDYRQPTFLCPCLQGASHNGDKVLVLAATNTPLLLDQVNLSGTTRSISKTNFESLTAKELRVGSSYRSDPFVHQFYDISNGETEAHHL
ncbi:hypothetical protein ACQ4PT_030997 [Festuca glaucescens]